MSVRYATTYPNQRRPRPRPGPAGNARPLPCSPPGAGNGRIYRGRRLLSPVWRRRMAVTAWVLALSSAGAVVLGLAAGEALLRAMGP